jgi:hypothetical protein
VKKAERGRQRRHSAATEISSIEASIGQFGGAQSPAAVAILAQQMPPANATATQRSGYWIGRRPATGAGSGCGDRARIGAAAAKAGRVYRTGFDDLNSQLWIQREVKARLGAQACPAVRTQSLRRFCRRLCGRSTPQLPD